VGESFEEGNIGMKQREKMVKEKGGFLIEETF